MRTKPTLDHNDAHAIADACLTEARARGATVTIAVVDDGGALLCLHRLDGAKSFTIDLASRKARTAAAVAVPTSILEQRAREGTLGNVEVLAVSGGVPVLSAGQCAGAVGVSGASGDVDEAIALAGARVLDAA